jgi:hypothetical protein
MNFPGMPNRGGGAAAGTGVSAEEQQQQVIVKQVMSDVSQPTDINRF